MKIEHERKNGAARSISKLEEKPRRPEGRPNLELKG